MSNKLQGVSDEAAIKVISSACREKYPDNHLLQNSKSHVSSLIYNSFHLNGDGTITHARTGLIWQRCSVGQTWSVEGCSGDAVKFTWAEAMKLEQDDWRLPNVEELDSLVYCSAGRRHSERPNGLFEFKSNGFCLDKYQKPTIDSVVFPHTAATFYWSSSLYFGEGSEPWYVDFGHGYVFSNQKVSRAHVRLVRTKL